MMKHYSFLRYLTPAALVALLASCTSSVPLQQDSARAASVAPSAPSTAEAHVLQPTAAASVHHDAGTSNAKDPRAYRADAAQHIYAMNSARIWKGRMPPLLYAIGVLQVEVDGKGNVRNLSWMRAPKHAPEVIAEIERTVRAAAPYPAPARMGKVVYTDTWLWHKSGRFQLDTLTEGQD
jgi:protein TonB